MKKATLTIFGLFLYIVCCYSQTSLDSVICKYLVQQKEINEPVNTIKRSGKRLVKNTNYFFEKKPVIRLSDSTALQPVIFGCYKSHTSKYLLVQIQRKSQRVSYFYGSNKLLYEIDKLKEQLLNNLKVALNDEALAALINYLSSCYL